MVHYSYQIPNKVIYSIGDTHARGREVIEFIQRLELRAAMRGEKGAAFIQVGDLCDGFALPEGGTEAMRLENRDRIDRIPELKTVIFQKGNRFVDWDHDLGVVGTMDAHDMLSSGDPDVITAVYQAFKSYETLMLYTRWQQAHAGQFHVIFGNHDADLIRGRCAYGRKQKYILLGLLGLPPEAVIAHMAEGRTRRVLRNPWIGWLSRRPHLIMGPDTVYMHGGPTAALSERFRAQPESFGPWLAEMDKARHNGMDDPAFREHDSFLSPDGAENDWTNHPDRILQFLGAAGKAYLAVGHSPFLDFEKGHMLDLKDPTLRWRFNTPAQLAPEGMLIKHDTNMKRTGGLWACRHEAGTDIWTGIDASLNETPLRMG